jgi:hypothetical protein
VENEIAKNPSAVTKRLEALKVANDGDGFLELALAIKTTAMKQIERNRHWEAKEIMEHYSNVFSNITAKNQTPSFLLKTLVLFPQNHHQSLNLLGVYPEVDAYIVEHKLRVDLFDPTTDSGIEDVIRWAAWKKDWAFVERFVCDLVNRTHEAAIEDHKTQRTIANFLVDGLLAVNYEAGTMTDAVDEQIASLIDSSADYRRSGLHIPKLADRGLSKTLMKMMEHGVVSRAGSRSQNDFGVILRCIPEELTLQQLYAVHYHLEVAPYAEKLLFDEAHSMDDFIEVLKHSNYGMYDKSDLDIGSVQSFSHLITPENFDNRERRKRILQLIDATLGKGTPYEKKSTEEVRKYLGYNNVPEFTFKHIHRLRGIELEDAMGL